MATPKLDDIAKAVGVSQSTVSRALSGKGSVDHELAARILAAAEQLGYPLERYRKLPNPSRLIGAIVPNISSPFYSALIESIEKAASHHGFMVVLCNSDYNLEQEQRCLSVLAKQNVDGILISPVEAHSTWPRAAQRIPVVQVDRHSSEINSDLVKTDSYQGAHEGVKFLIRQGYRRIALINGPKSHSTGRERLNGFLAALREAEIRPPEEYIQLAEFRQEDGYQLALKLLDLDPRPDALFVANVDMTIGALKALHERKIDIPGEVAIIGFDDFEFASILVPPLTTIEQPIQMLGVAAVDLLARRIARTAPPNPVTVKLAPRIILRNSTLAHASGTSYPSVDGLAVEVIATN